MHILLDTHLFIWWLKNDRHLSKKACSIILNAHEVYISSVSIWEAAIKIRVGKLDAKIADLINSIEKEGFIELPLTAKHAGFVTELPPYHRDPFDRVLVAQCICEPLRLLTADMQLKPYSELIEIV
ncbi:MAG: twitching motility protein PilT [Gammaproteobacteria bacterium RIFCSPHIGHO2_12_FULL_37_34]|nr:MAG: twitching motility protein PilT [Gammaproteobacteria bacterium RIFCSPHIGHO2_12_FULL_37_34]